MKISWVLLVSNLHHRNSFSYLKVREEESLLQTGNQTAPSSVFIYASVRLQ